MPGAPSEEQEKTLVGLWVGVSSLGTGWAFSVWALETLGQDSLHLGLGACDGPGACDYLL